MLSCRDKEVDVKFDGVKEIGVLLGENPHNLMKLSSSQCQMERFSRNLKECWSNKSFMSEASMV